MKNKKANPNIEYRISKHIISDFGFRISILFLLIVLVFAFGSVAFSEDEFGSGTTYNVPSQVLDMGGKTRAGSGYLAVDAIGQPGIGTAAGGSAPASGPRGNGADSTGGF